MKLLLEKTHEYNIQIHLAFVNFHKAFHTMETWVHLRAMDNERIDRRYSNLIHNTYTNASMPINDDEDLQNDNIPVGRGVRQGDTISDKLGNK